MSESTNINFDDSILLSIAKLIGGEENGTYFNKDLIIAINTALSILCQVGVGPDGGFAITGNESKWSDFLDDDARLNMAVSYVYLKVKLLFDPPTSGVLRETMEKQIDEMEWRSYFEADTQRLDKLASGEGSA